MIEYILEKFGEDVVNSSGRKLAELEKYIFINLKDY